MIIKIMVGFIICNLIVMVLLMRSIERDIKHEEPEWHVDWSLYPELEIEYKIRGLLK